jgi:hypothetical protein
MDKEEIEKILFASKNNTYGDKYIEHLLEQYKIYINAAEKISDRRQKTNEFFLGLNTALVTLLGFLITKSGNAELPYILGLASIAGAVMCYLWYRILRSYKGLNSGKFKVIHAIEARLPLALYDTEWEVLGRGKNKEKYWPFSHIELIVPQVFIGIYLLFLLSLIPWGIIFLTIKCFIF